MPCRLGNISLAGLFLTAAPLPHAHAHAHGYDEARELAPVATAQGGLPEAVRAMITAAIATGDAVKVDTVVEIARQTNPGSLDAIDALADDFHTERLYLAAQTAASKEQELRKAGLFQNWGGRGELGATHSTGNTNETGVTARLSLKREGIDWTHKLLASIGYQRTAGRTSKEQFLFSYEPNFNVSDRLFTFGLSQYERDRFQGFTNRISVSGGMGYNVIDKDRMNLAIKGGPAWRHIVFTGPGSDGGISALAALDFNWQFNKGMKLTQDASAYMEAANSTLQSATGLEAKLNSRLAARLSYTAERNTDPPLGAVKTDTRTHFTVIYDF